MPISTVACFMRQISALDWWTPNGKRRDSQQINHWNISTPSESKRTYMHPLKTEVHCKESLHERRVDLLLLAPLIPSWKHSQIDYGQCFTKRNRNGKWKGGGRWWTTNWQVVCKEIHLQPAVWYPVDCYGLVQQEQPHTWGLHLKIHSNYIRKTLTKKTSHIFHWEWSQPKIIRNIVHPYKRTKNEHNEW